jgi:hypothetical protein
MTTDELLRDIYRRIGPNAAPVKRVLPKDLAERVEDYLAKSYGNGLKMLRLANVVQALGPSRAGWYEATQELAGLVLATHRSDS